MACAAAAQTLRDCDTWEANARNLMAPPDVAVQSFANGEIRVMGLDTIEPACCFAHILVTHPLPDDPYPGCTLISDSAGRGISGVRMEALEARYDPAIGLILTLPVGAYDGSASVFRPFSFVVNQATGTVSLP